MTAVVEHSEPVAAESSGLSLPQAWTTIAVAAAAMIATLPGRTFGLGLVERQMSGELGLTEMTVGHINLWATLIGALACFPAGWIIDRCGLRVALFGTALCLGAVTRALASVDSAPLLFLLVLCTRAFGQSALSVVSIAIVGKSFDRKKSWPMAAFSVLMTIGFMTAFGVVGPAVQSSGWRYEDYYETAKAAAPLGLVGQGLCGFLARHWSYQRLTTIGAVVYAAGILWLTRVDGRGELLAASMTSGLGGGMLTVVFFAAFPRLFGRRELGRIQGFAQLLTVVASAIGPLAFAASVEYLGSFRPALVALAAVIVVVGSVTLFAQSPKLPHEEGSDAQLANAVK